MVPIEYLGRHSLALDHHRPRQNGGAKILPIMRYGAPNHRSEHHRSDTQAEEDLEFEDGNARGMAKAPGVHMYHRTSSAAVESMNAANREM